MGEIADDMIDGRCCSWCGVYFEQAHHYPVACKSCWQETRELPEWKDIKGNPKQDQIIFDETGIDKATIKEL